MQSSNKRSRDVHPVSAGSQAERVGRAPGKTSAVPARYAHVPRTAGPAGLAPPGPAYSAAELDALTRVAMRPDLFSESGQHRASDRAPGPDDVYATAAAAMGAATDAAGSSGVRREASPGPMQHMEIDEGREHGARAPQQRGYMGIKRIGSSLLPRFLREYKLPRFLRPSGRDKRQASNSAASLEHANALIKQETLTRMALRLSAQMENKSTHLAGKTAVSFSLQSLMGLSDELYEKFSNSPHAGLVSEYPLIEQAIQDAHALIRGIHDHIDIERTLADLNIKQSPEKFITSATLEKVKTSILDDVKKAFPDVNKIPVMESLTRKQISLAFKEAHFRVLPRNEQELLQSREELKQEAQSNDPDKVITEKNASILIVGAGPAGLLAAIKASESGHSVTLVEKRETFDRLVIVKLHPGSGGCERAVQIIDYAKKIQESNPEAKINSRHIQHIIDGLSKDPPFIKTKDLQSLLANYINTFLGPNQQSAAPVRYISDAEIQVIDGNSQSAVVRHHKDGSLSLESFRDVIHADGAKGSSHEQLVKRIQNGGVQDYQDIKSKKEQYEGNRYRYQAAMYMMDAKERVILRPGQPTLLPLEETIGAMQPKQQEATLNKLKQLGWSEEKLPGVYMFQDTDGKRVWVAGERPESIKSQKEVEKWFNTISQIALNKKLDLKKKQGAAPNALGHKSRDEKGIKNTLKKLERQSARRDLPADERQLLENSTQRYERKLRKNQLNGAIFNLDPAALPYEQTAKNIGLNGVSYVIGDAAVLPNFHYAHGTTDAFEDADVAIESINMADREAGAANFRDYMEARIEGTLNKFGANSV